MRDTRLGSRRTLTEPCFCYIIIIIFFFFFFFCFSFFCEGKPRASHVLELEEKLAIAYAATLIGGGGLACCQYQFLRQLHVMVSQRGYYNALLQDHAASLCFQGYNDTPPFVFFFFFFFSLGHTVHRPKFDVACRQQWARNSPRFLSLASPHRRSGSHFPSHLRLQVWFFSLPKLGKGNRVVGISLTF
ncbi:uncharacterized protein GGS25DRAFT_174070 [Hypoxylon fragiforme]|uniref:uncharacterized protein n=1 Tax=Hypoxylon fragiforme TaxID=63214 RepID=UPI0020C60022|nr:uncharacterized protein GGS25DRAFT_174070 [Hypoxylon fragiforme]KAI2610939.1 hypothetical protein GGS25DRAFT_174070 [Hypoxylon fragiforme]